MILLRFGLAAIVVFIAGCGVVPQDVDRPVSYAFSDTDDTALAGIVRSVDDEHDGQSGIRLLPDGYQALETRLAMVDMAEKSVDIQTFIWKTDTAARLLAKHLLDAAERGTRVRVLLDDYILKDRDFGLSAFDAHPNVELRIFNPWGTRIKFGRSTEMVTNLSRLNHRMHNKVFVADNQLAIVGGRNVGDEYYSLDEKYNFIDLDVLMCGPAVRDVSASFDEYWNSAWAYPITAFKDHPADEKVRELTEWLRQWVKQRRQELNLRPVQSGHLRELAGQFVWAPVEVSFEDPDKANGSGEPHVVRVGPKLRELSERSESQILLASPYVVVGSAGGPHGRFASAARRGHQHPGQFHGSRRPELGFFRLLEISKGSAGHGRGVARTQAGHIELHQ